jgi:methylthioribose-1-phosphate isomerase
LETLYWKDGVLYVLDQTVIPHDVEYVSCRTYSEAADTIRSMQVRGAPAIGVVAAYGMVLAALAALSKNREELQNELIRASSILIETRPTAVNLRWALERMMARAAAAEGDSEAVCAVMLNEAEAIFGEDISSNERMGAYGQELVPQQARILTHCNAGALATAGFGTALGVIRAAHRAGKEIGVYATETRPYMQGTRLTTFELMREGIEVTLITDGMAAYLMSARGLDLVVVGADRIAANGDVANKIGTYGLAVSARFHGVPFYVAAPRSTIDMRVPDGARIPIEERDHVEITHFRGGRVAPEGVGVWNPAFDITPNELITAIITEAGVLRSPYGPALEEIMWTEGT